MGGTVEIQSDAFVAALLHSGDKEGLKLVLRFDLSSECDESSASRLRMVIPSFPAACVSFRKEGLELLKDVRPKITTAEPNRSAERMPATGHLIPILHRSRLEVEEGAKQFPQGSF